MLKKHTDQFSKIVKHLVSNGVQEENAIQRTLNGIANGSINLKDADSNDLILRQFVAYGRLVQTELDFMKTGPIGLQNFSLLASNVRGFSPLMMAGAKNAFPILEEVGVFAGTGGKALKTGGDALKIGSQAVNTGGQVLKTGGQSLNVMKTISTVAIVTSVVLTVVDVAFLIRDWTSDHPTIEVINDVIRKLRVEVNGFKDLLSTIDSFKDRIYVATIDEIPIISSTMIMNDAMISLLNQDVPKCIQILHEFEIDCPFDNRLTPDQLAKFISQQGAASGFDEVELKAIIRKTGKRAASSVRCLVNNLVVELEKKASSKLSDPNQKKRSHRGEHVINNNVLSVHRDIIDLFLRHQFGIDFQTVEQRLGRESQIVQDYRQPFEEDIKMNIQNRMIARIPDHLPYIDVNALLYGVLIYILRNSAKYHMSDLYNNPRTDGTAHTTKIRVSVAPMNQLFIYVDDMAKTYWLTYNGERSRSAVQTMFLQLYEKLRWWVLDLKRHGY